MLKHFTAPSATALVVALFCLGCTSGTDNNNNGQSATEWFNSKNWERDNLKLDNSADKEILSKYYHRHPERWDTAMAFLLNPGLESMEPGRYDLIDGDVWAMISEAPGRQPDTSFFESHKKFADIQHVIRGKEIIQLTDTTGLEVTTPYNEENDIIFYNAPKFESHTATPEKYFIFFPQNIHKPALRENDELIKKLVIKVRLD